MEIVTLGSEAGEAVLHLKAQPVQDINTEVQEKLQAMIGTMITGHGVGLAAPQVNDLRRMFVIKIEDQEPRIFINPEILETSLEESVYEEGCLSVPGVFDKIIRPAALKVQAWNERGRPFTLEAEGFLARVIQHEYDHLQGVLFVDRLAERRRNRILKAYARLQGHAL